MACNPYYNILFEPVNIGPVTAPNRFYQTPHANGMGYTKPNSSTAFREVRAEGGWGVVCTEYCSIHPSSDDSPYAFLTMWDQSDVRASAKTVDAIHKHGSLAGVELWHGGFHTNNRLTREPVLAPSECAVKYAHPAQARAMDKRDIAEFRGWQKKAALRAKEAGFDIVYVYAGHEFLPFQFLSSRFNHRTDEYGGSLSNRVRLLREMIEDTKDAVGDKCAVAVRLAVDELHGPSGITCDEEGREIVSMLAELPDLWDVNLAGMLGNDSCSSRFSAEGYQEQYIGFVKSVTTKPVVSVGRFTSPDTMVSQIKRGVQDFIGAARPSIADPFLPQKIWEGREDEIRECIGCNICRSSNNEGAPLRCSQNPTVGEEWRRAWHPERVEEKKSNDQVLVVGAGPAGLEATLTLAKRGYRVTLAESTRELGGRVVKEASLPGLKSWMGVRDYREYMLGKMDNVEVYRESHMTAADILELGIEHVVVATGSRWRRDGVGTYAGSNDSKFDQANILTPDDIFSEAQCEGPVLIYDDEHYFMGGALAEQFALAGHEVTLVTPESMISAWTGMTDEQYAIQKKLMDLGVTPVFSQQICDLIGSELMTECVYTGKVSSHQFTNLIMVTSRIPDRGLYDELIGDQEKLDKAGIKSVTRIGDCLVPSSIADAVHSGHRFAREMDEQVEDLIVLREIPQIA